MKPRILLLLAALSVVGSGRSEQGDDKASLDTLLFAHEIEVEEAGTPSRERREKLNQGYVRVLERLLGEKQKAGDLEGLLAIRKEIEQVEEAGVPGKDPYPGDEGMRFE